MNKCTIRFMTPCNSPVICEKEFEDCRMAIIWAQEQCKNPSPETPYIEAVIISSEDDFEIKFLPDDCGVSGTVIVTVGGFIKRSWNERTDDFCSEPVARFLHHDHETFEKCYVEIVDQVWSKITGMKEAFLALAEDDYDDIISFIQRQNDGKEITAYITQKYYSNDLNNTNGDALLTPMYLEWARAFWGGFFRVDFDKDGNTQTGKDNSEIPF